LLPSASILTICIPKDCNTFFLDETNMIAGNTKGDENPTVACKHGVPSVDLNLKLFSDEKSNRANV